MAGRGAQMLGMPAFFTCRHAELQTYNSINDQSYEVNSTMIALWGGVIRKSKDVLNASLLHL